MLMKKQSIMLLVSTLFVLMSGCSGGGGSDDSTDDNTTNATGYSQKGPFVKGSRVTAYQLIDGERTDKNVTTNTFDNRGRFSLFVPWIGPAEIEVTGSYLDENSGNLRADGNLSAVVNGTYFNSTNVNIFTHLAAARIKEMLKEGATFEEAQLSAKQEVKELFNLDLSDGINLTDLDLVVLGADGQADSAQLLKVSAALLGSENPSALLEALRKDIKDGKVDGGGLGALDEIVKKIPTLDMPKIGKILSNHTGYTGTIPVSPDLLAGKLPLNAKIFFDDIVDAEPSKQYFTKTIPLVGFEGNLTLSVSGGAASALIMNNEGESKLVSTSSSTLIESGSTLALTQLAPSTYSTTRTTSFDISGRKFEWNITTKTNPNAVDTTPNDFDLGVASNVNPSTYALSKEIKVSGLSEGTYVDANISGGRYSINGDANTTSPSRVMNGDTIVVSALSSGTFLGEKKATLNIGGESGEFTVYTRARNTAAQTFTPQTLYNVPINSVHETQFFTMSGYEGGLELDVVNGEAQVEGESSWHTHISSFPAGYKVKFRQTASSEYNTQTDTTITFGSFQTTFSTITQENPNIMDLVPNAVTFATQYDVKPINKEIISDEVVLSGMANGVGATLKMNSPSYAIQVNGGDWSYEPVSGLKAGDKIRVKITNVYKSDTKYASYLEYLDENGDYKIFGEFIAYTATIDTTPDDIAFESVTDAELFKSYFSNEVTISGLDDDANISATILGNQESSNYRYNINDTGWKNTPGYVTLKNGDGVQLRLASSNNQGETERMFLNFNDKSIVYSVTSNIAPKFYNRPAFENIEVGDNINFTPIVRDTQEITFSLENAPSWLELNATTGNIGGVVASGSYKDVKLIATDSGGLSSFVTFDLVADIAPVISSASFTKEFILDDNYKGAHNYGINFTISDADTAMADLNVTVAHAITESRVPAEGLSKGFNYSSVECESDGKCTANISIEFTRPDGLHPSLKTRHTFTVSDGDKNATNYVDIWYAPTTPQLSGEAEQLIAFTSKFETEYRQYSFTPENAANQAESWSINNKPKWADFNTSTGELSGTPALDQNGTYADIQVTASNDRGSDTFTFNIVVKDKTPPKKFEITDYYGVEINKYYDTFLTVDWLADGASANISSSGYEGQETHSGFSVNGDNTITTVKNGDVVRVGHLSSNEYDTTLRTTITIGEDSDDFITHTKASASAKLPLIVGAPKMNGNIYEDYSYTPQMSTDYDHFAPTTKPFEIQNKPEWAAFNATTGELSGTPTETGVYQGVKIIAYGDNGLDDITFDITIDNYGPTMSGSNLSLENDNLDLTFNDNSNWRGGITEVSLYSCYEQNAPIILASDDYTFSEGALALHVSTSSNVALHTPSMGGTRLIVKAEGYQDSESTLDIISDGQYGIYATLSAPTPLTEENLDGAKVEIALENTLAFKDTTLDASNFTFSNAPEDLYIDSVTYKDATHAELTLSYDGIDFDTDALLSINIAASELNTPCAVIETNAIGVVAIVEKPFINMLYPDDPSEDAHFGYSVADDNNTIAVGARTGLYIFKKGADGNYTQTQKIASSYGHDFFASALAMDGDYLLVGDGNYKNMDTNKSFVGSADIYKKDANGDYQFLQDLTPPDNAEYDHFGSSLDISKDMIIVGADNADEHKGKAYLYKKDGSGNFALINTLTRANGKAMDSFGYDVAITHGLEGTPEANNYFMLVGSNVMPNIYKNENGEFVTDTKEELGAGFANYYAYIDDVLSTPVVMSADDSSDLADHFGSAVALDAVMVTIGSNKRVYVYARGEGDAIGQRSKIEDAGSASGKGLEVKWSGFDNHARYVVVAGRQSFISKEDWTFNRYESSLENNDDLGYAASVSGFEVAYGSYSNSDIVSEGGAVLVTHAYENITSTTSSALTPPELSATNLTGLSIDENVYSFEADDNWKSAITNILYKAGVNADYSVLSSSDYVVTDDNYIRLQIASSSNVALHTPYQSAGSLLVKADGYLDDVLTINGMGGTLHAIKAEVTTQTPLKEDNLDGAILNIVLSNTLEFEDATLESSNFTLVGAPNGTTVKTVTYVDATHANLTLAFDSTDFDDNASLNLAINAAEFNAYEGVRTNALEVEAITEVAGSGVTLQAIDPYITNARFWYDKNGNGQVEDFELSSYSDENGSFSFTTTLDENGSVVMVESGLHNARVYDGNLTLIYNSNAPAIISPVTTLLAKSFTLDEIRTLLVDAGVDSGLTTDELRLDPFDSSLLPADGNMSTFLSPELSKFRRVLMANVVLNAVLASTQSYELDKDSINAALTTIYSAGEDGGGGPNLDTSLLSYFVSVGNIVLSDGGLKSYNAKARARTFVAISNYVSQIIKNYIANNGAVDDFIVYELDGSVSQKIFDIIEALTDSYQKAIDVGVVDPKIEWIKKQDEDSYRPFWMVEVANLGIQGQDAIMVIYKDANGDEQNVQFYSDGDYLENYQHFGTWSVSNGKVLANSKEFEFRGTHIRIDGIDYSIIDVGFMLHGSIVLENFYEELPTFTTTFPDTDASYVDVNSSFVFNIHENVLEDVFKEHTVCNLSQGYVANEDVNVSFGTNSIIVTPVNSFKHNRAYNLGCSIRYGDDSSYKSISFTSEELYFPVLATGQEVSYNADGTQASTPCDVRDDGCYQTGRMLLRTDNGDTVTDLQTGLVWEDDGQTDTNSAGKTKASYGPCEMLDLNGTTDWRAPTALEMMSLFDFQGTGVNGFENISTSSTGYWTSTIGFDSTSYNSDEYLYVIMPKYLANTGETYSKMHMCVRINHEKTTDKAEMKKEGDVVIDYKDSLEWSDDTSVDTDRTWIQAIGACEASTLGGYNDWRLPNINELVRTAGHSMTPSDDINQAGYPNSVNTVFTATSFYEEFWSSTTDKSTPENAYILQGRYGSIISAGKSTMKKVRCVRTR